ncbi:hypothetical protein VaNZ11_009597 [Volvox africanus]|uniref:Uncharacterized protein n=1 Tax=Volvox africanus TaxID=51714 RepID=A0ABQ5S7Q1_9CHLO|nr:hypothetical protein VaNZ11_009597 [Volvox africanus]
MNMMFDIDLDDGCHFGGAEGVQEGAGLLGCQQDTQTADGSRLGTSAVFGVWMDPRLNPKICAQPPAFARRSHRSATQMLAPSVPSSASGSLQQRVMVALRDIVSHSAAHHMVTVLRNSGFNVRMVAPVGGRCCYSHHDGGGYGAASVSHRGRRMARPAPRRDPAAAAPGFKAKRRQAKHHWTIRDPYLLVLPSPGAPCFLEDRVDGRSADASTVNALATACIAAPIRRRTTFGGAAGHVRPDVDGSDGGGGAVGQDDDEGGSDIWRQQAVGGSPRHRRHRSDLTATQVPAADTELSSSVTLGMSVAAAAAPHHPEELVEPFVVEPGLRDLFRLGVSTPQYDNVVSRLPEVWVGPRAALMELADIMCLVMEVHFRSQGLDVPPWRRRDAVMSRWDPNNQREVEHQQLQKRRWKQHHHHDDQDDHDNHDDRDGNHRSTQDSGVAEQRREEEQEEQVYMGGCKGPCSTRTPLYRSAVTEGLGLSPEGLSPQPRQSSGGFVAATAAYAPYPWRSSTGSGVSRGTLSSAGMEEAEEEMLLLGREGASPQCVLLLPGGRSNGHTEPLVTTRTAATAAAARPAAVADKALMARRPSGDEAVPRRPEPVRKLGGPWGLAERAQQLTKGQGHGKAGFGAPQDKEQIVDRRQHASGITAAAAPATVYGFHIVH